VWSTEGFEGVVVGARWPGLTSLVMVESIRQLGEKDSLEWRYYLSSLLERCDQFVRTLLSDIGVFPGGYCGVFPIDCVTSRKYYPLSEHLLL
jgi:hypothetical protein